jgi:ferredoxin--NADP+ reductase
MSNIPLQTYKAKEPFIGKIISVKRIVGAQATGETCNIVIDHQGKMPYWEGQSYGVIPPGSSIFTSYI